MQIYTALPQDDSNAFLVIRNAVIHPGKERSNKNNESKGGKTVRHQARLIVIVLSLIVLNAPMAFGTCIHVKVQDFMSPQAGISDIASGLGLQPQGEVTGLFPGMSLTAVLGPSGAGKSTLLGGHGFAAGEKVRITNAGGSKLTIERLGGAPLTIHVQVDDFFQPGR